MVRASTGLPERRLQSRPDLTRTANIGLGHQETKAQWPSPDRAIRRPRVGPDQVRQLMGDGVRRTGVRGPPDLEKEDRRGPAVARVPGRLVAKRGGPIRARVELAGSSRRAGARLDVPTRNGRSAGPVQEGLDPGIRSFVVLVVRQDKPTRSAWLSCRRGGQVVSRVGHADKV